MGLWLGHLTCVADSTRQLRFTLVFVPILLLLGLNLSQTRAQEAAIESIPKLDFYKDIQPIFNEHCSECHGEKQAKAELNVSDKSALLSYVAPGDLESSSLWTDYLTSSDDESRMPPVKHNKPLSALQLAAIRVWILDGAPWPEAAPAPAVQAAIPTPAPPASLIAKLMTFVGFFHPAIVHFPIALLLVSTLFLLMSFVSRATFEPAAFHLLWMGAIGAVVASVMGWSFAEIRGYGDFWSTSFSEDAIARHRIAGVGLSVLSVLMIGVAMWSRGSEKFSRRVIWLFGSAMLALLVSITGHQGGELTYGEDLMGRAYKQAFGETSQSSPPPAIEAANPVNAKTPSENQSKSDS